MKSMTNQEAADKLLKFYNSSLGIIGHMKEELGEPIEKAVDALRVVDSLRSENEFLKGMQRQLVSNNINNLEQMRELGIMVNNARKGLHYES